MKHSAAQHSPQHGAVNGSRYDLEFVMTRQVVGVSACNGIEKHTEGDAGAAGGWVAGAAGPTSPLTSLQHRYKEAPHTLLSHFFSIVIV
jgi:hypothetical protein